MENLIKTLKTKIVDVDINILYVLSLSYVTFAVIVFIILYFGITAPYGRYSRGGWGTHLNGKAAWFLQEIPSFIVPVLMLFMEAPRAHQLPNLLLTSLFLLHYFQRSCIFPFLIKGGKPTPFVPFIMALVFCTVNGYLQTGYLLYHADYGTDWYFRTHILIGVPMFMIGMVINIHSDHVLRNLRSPGETGYKIPKGGMFHFISGANFFGEMLEWAGFAVATWSIPALAFSFFTCCNIGPRAYQHHQYYLQKFEDYPKERRAVIPLLL